MEGLYRTLQGGAEEAKKKGQPRAPATAPAVKRTAELGNKATAAVGRLTIRSPNLGFWLLPSTAETCPSSKTGISFDLCPFGSPAAK